MVNPVTLRQLFITWPRNVRHNETITSTAAGHKIIFIPGQAEDNASIQPGCAGINTNTAGVSQHRKKRLSYL